MTSNPTGFIRIPYQEMFDTFYAILLRHGFSERRAKACAEIFAVNSLEGVYTHGVNRFPVFVGYVKDGYIRVNEAPVMKSASGSLEQWDGKLGPGPLNAVRCTERSMDLARLHGIGCVALANTNHWMRGGLYGWNAARKGFVFIGWTNTVANMPAWSAVDSRLGNNPLVIAIPYEEHAIVLDMAMSQYSYGALELYRLKNEPLPAPGGYDTEGKLTQDASAIIASRRALPIGFWKGAGLSLVLDILAAILSGGLSTSEISQQQKEYAVSQVFISIDISRLASFSSVQKTIDHIIKYYQSSIPEEKTKHVRYPGERIVHTREENLTKGIPVSEEVWRKIAEL